MSERVWRTVFGSCLGAAALVAATGVSGCQQEPEAEQEQQDPAERLRAEVEQARDEQEALLTRQQEIDRELQRVRPQQRELARRERELEQQSQELARQLREEQQRSQQLAERVDVAEQRREQEVASEHQRGEEHLAAGRAQQGEPRRGAASQPTQG